MNKESINIGVPDLNEEELLEIIKYTEDTIRNYIFSKINPKFVDDFNLEIVLEKLEELTVNINIELNFSNIEIPNANEIVNESLEIGVKALKEKVSSLKN
ncbi:MAG: DUF3194 domain-containing protein [Candidatus Helarchaeota archaeon]